MACLNHRVEKHFGWSCFTKMAMTGYSILTSHTIVGRVSCRLPTEPPRRLKKYARLCSWCGFYAFYAARWKAFCAPSRNALLFMLPRWNYAVFYAIIIGRSLLIAANWKVHLHVIDSTLGKMSIQSVKYCCRLYLCILPTLWQSL